MESHRIQEQQQKQLRQNPPTTIHHLHHHRLHLFPQPKPDQLNLKHLATLHHRRQQLHRFVFLPNHHHQPVHLHPGLADRALVDAHIIVFIVIPRNVDYNVLDHHIQDTVPQQSTQRVAEHPHHTVADLQPVDQNHHAVTLHRILLDAAEHLPEAPLSLHRHHVAWTLDLSLHRMLMTPGTGKTTNLTPIARMTEDLVHH